MIELSENEIARFQEDGFLIRESLIDPALARRVAGRFDALFQGRFETGLYPDEWNWKEGRDAQDLTRQICNGWKSDYTVASVALRADIGRACARLRGWPGARINQDNVLWKPPGAKALGFHQDDSYEAYIQPQEMVTCWIALDDTSAEGGTLEFVRGSHRWGLFPPIEKFHAPENYRREMEEAAASVGVEPEIVPVVVPAGGGSFHHGLTWHGSAHNRATRPRRALAIHCVSSEARFHPTEVGYIYSRYKRFGDETMDESYFPILWTEDGRRSAFLEDYLKRGQRTGRAA